jgi:glycosyltransferase involved in cell wall biosynthesis
MSSPSSLHAISSHGPTAASTRVRLDDWFRFLGIGVTHHYYAGLNNNRLRSVAARPLAVSRAELTLRRLDMSGQRIVVSRESSPFSRGDIEERLLRCSAHGVYDFEDALFHDLSQLRRLLRTRDKCRRSVAAADVVIAGNDLLANWAEHHNHDVRVIPSCIDPRDHAPKSNWSIAGDVLALAWLGSPATEHYLGQITPALLEINRRTGAVLIVISGPAHNARLGRLNQMVQRIPWSIKAFASAMTNADVAIAPLDETPYSRSKCAYKLLQYAATGLPIVGSPVGANRLALERFSGIAVTKIDDWLDALMAIIHVPSKDRSMRGATGTKAVKEHYSFAAWASAWQDAVGLS